MCPGPLSRESARGRGKSDPQKAPLMRDFRNSLAGFRAWNRALSSEEVKRLYEEGLKRLPSGPGVAAPARSASDGSYVGQSEYVQGRGRRFDEAAYAAMPLVTQSPNWTLDGWFEWTAGAGPLICADAEPWEWGWLYDSGGQCAYRIGGVERRTDLKVTSVRERRIYVAVAKTANEAILWLNDEVADRWDGAPLLAMVSNCVVMKHAVGFAEAIAAYDRRLPDDAFALRRKIGRDGIGD